MTFPPLFPLALCGSGSFHASGTIGAVFPPVGFWEKLTAALGTAFQFCPVQKGGFQFPVKGKYGRGKPAAEKRIADTLHTYTRLAIIQHKAVAVIIVTALMHKAAGGSVLWVVHVGAFTVHFPAPFPVPAHGVRFGRYCFLQSAIPLCVPSFPGTRCKGCSSPS